MTSKRRKGLVVSEHQGVQQTAFVSNMKGAAGLPFTIDMVASSCLVFSVVLFASLRNASKGVKGVSLWESTWPRIEVICLYLINAECITKLHPVSTICFRDNGTPLGCSLVALSTSSIKPPCSEEPKTPGPEIWFKTWKKTTGSC